MLSVFIFSSYFSFGQDKPELVLPIGNIKQNYAEFSPNGQMVLTSAEDKTVKLWNTHTGKLLHSFYHNSPIVIAHFSPDGEKVASISISGEIYVHNISTGEMLYKNDHIVFEPVDIIFSSNSKKIIIYSDFKIVILKV